MISDMITATLRSAEADIKQRHVCGLYLYGSQARDDARPDSDIDLLEDFDQPVSLLAVAGLQNSLTRMLGRTVDIGMLAAVRKKNQHHILSEMVRVW